MKQSLGVSHFPVVKTFPVPDSPEIVSLSGETVPDNKAYVRFLLIDNVDIFNACNFLELGLIELAWILTDISKDTAVDINYLSIDEI